MKENSQIIWESVLLLQHTAETLKSCCYSNLIIWFTFMNFFNRASNVKAYKMYVPFFQSIICTNNKITNKTHLNSNFQLCHICWFRDYFCFSILLFWFMGYKIDWVSQILNLYLFVNRMWIQNYFFCIWGDFSL